MRKGQESKSAGLLPTFHSIFFFPVGYAGAQEVLFSLSGVHAQYFFLVVGGT